ncbi:hypothetical protein HPP92_023058 [Vanilla planifolia]|uniref:Uncharacterized protein n=1 Tax=Vanilla planifolia TaxID=51239 RepID=A0A835PWJ5_VANPL|nr:hypothetical protein HPP92_023058 [Vanilla planifolia]
MLLCRRYYFVKEMLERDPLYLERGETVWGLYCMLHLEEEDRLRQRLLSSSDLRCGDIIAHGHEVSQTRGRPSSSSSVDKSEPPHFGTIQENQEYAGKKKVSANVDTAARRLKFLLRWPNQKEKRTDDESMGSLMKWSEQEETLTSAAEIFRAMPHLASTQQWTQVSPLSRPLMEKPSMVDAMGEYSGVTCLPWLE